MRRIALLILAGFLCFGSAYSQLAPHIYWIQFTDKQNSTFSLSRPLEFLSSKSLERRTRQGLSLSESDLPVTISYLDSLRKEGGKILFTSRWQNAATVYSPDSTYLEKIQKYSFVKSGFKVYKTGIKVHSVSQNMLASGDTYSANDYGGSYAQVHLHNGDAMHNEGFRGQNMIIGILDAGFYKADSLKAFQKLRDRKGILGVHDFVGGNDSVYNSAEHGMIVLSVIAGYLPGKLIGTAPEAGFYLFRTENAVSEFEVEEATWIAGMEKADSAGVDVINSSLGYTQFDDPKMNHTYVDMDGHTTIISKEASMAASKGMILVNSAGNSGSKPWHYISAPADAENILTVGAVGKDRILAGYSSRGPTYDGRVKPDVCADGYQTICASTVDGETEGANGTSLSAPVITGLTACLWQEFPDKTCYDIMDAIRKSADRYSNPDDSFGYGIPDFSIARQLLKFKNTDQDFLADIYPNPFTDHITINFYTTHAQQADVFLINIMGKLVWTRKIQTLSQNITQVDISTATGISPGIYFLGVKTNAGVMVQKIMKN
jgi:serine protease AprX